MHARVPADATEVGGACNAWGMQSEGPTWRSAVGGTPGFSESRAATPVGGTTQLGLQFELREQTPRTLDRWRGPTARTARASAAGESTYRLGVRPVIRGKSGGWTRQNVTWTTLPHQVNRLGLDEAQHRWFLQFAALHRSTRVTFLGQDADWLYLDEFVGPVLWPLLADAERLGIAMLGSRGGTVQIGEHAAIRLDLALDPVLEDSALEDGSAEADGDLLLTTVLEIDGVAFAPRSSAAIGDHGLYAYAFAPTPSITLAPTDVALTPEHKQLLGQETPVRVPADDIAEFLAVYYPRLRRTIDVSSDDESVELPELLPPILVLTATYAPKHVLKLDWHWEFDGGEDAPLENAAADPATLDRLREVPGVPLHATTLTGLDAAEFTTGVLPVIEATTGVRVDIVGTRPDYRELVEQPHLSLTTMQSDRRDWLDLGVTITIDGRVIPFTPLFKAISTGRKKLLLVDNSYLSLDQPVFERLRELIDEAGLLTEWETGPRISRYHASLFADFEDLADETDEAVAWRATAHALLDATVEPTPPPAALEAELRPYQKTGFDWLTFLWRHGLGGVLADDMGLGKTLQTLALVAHAIEASEGETRLPFLVVAPTSVVSNWAREAEKFAPSLVVASIATTQKKSTQTLADIAAGADIVVTSYALLRLDFGAYQAIDWAGAVFDEAQFLKNPASKVHGCAVDLRAPFKLALTGTPLENSLTDVWSMFAVTAPGLFPSLRRFTEQYVRPIERGSNARSRKAAGTVGVSGARADDSSDEYSRMLIARLRRRIRPLMLRRTKELVASDLPARQEQELRIELSPRHRKLYDVVLQRERQKLLGLIDDLDRNRFIVFRSITLLRMLSLDASLIDPAYADVPSSKLDALEEQLQDVVAEGHRALIFSQFTSFLHRAAARLDALGIEYAYLDGSTRRRAEVIDRFRDGTAPVFLISLKAGGFGLNLTEADYVFLLDPWWNPAAESQAVDRTHRIGQTRQVMVYRMVADGTIEDKVMALKAQKAQLFDAVLDDDAVFSSTLTADDIRGLLEP